jgi:hypothetical protein
MEVGAGDTVFLVALLFIMPPAASRAIPDKGMVKRQKVLSR